VFTCHVNKNFSFMYFSYNIVLNYNLADDEEEYEEGGGGNRFLGFMFGNVDNSGDLDVDYLDEVFLFFP